MSINWYRGIIVGVDGSDESLVALDWAARAADLHEARLTVLATYAVPITPDPGIGDLIGEMRDQANQAARAARNLLGSRRPGGHDLEVVVVPGAAAYELIQRAEAHELVVVGRRGLGAFDRLLLGSTSAALAATTPGAVAVVPAGASAGDPRRIRVGVGRNDEPDVLGAAFSEADVRGCTLEILHVTGSDPITSALPEMDPVAASWHEAAMADLADRVARWSEKYPRVTCSVVIRRGDRISALLYDLAPDDLVIVGGHRHPPVMGHLLRSAPDAVLRAAPCPVLVVHAQR
ncbi:nucleotide-binding universal stress UspA family protein [Promicromonospora sp. AC04]|uniref:universal stress protein n=1 Tax=Promicromonospora sp. AC04 TaxID=2135723 RepID=UPI000D401384|nr:universal stress protein [Promicromonospora sp. AC04]PUB27576.1 nucleotide-binding universal stress UspA family protein [Promicromonospora sp. AC04]